MLKPSGVANVLESKLHPQEIEYEHIGEMGVTKYAYHLEFDEYKTLTLLNEQTREAARIVELELIVAEIQPVIHLKDNRVEARLRLTIRETMNRRKLENHDLNEFKSGE